MAPKYLTVTGNRSSIDHRGLGNFNPDKITVSLGTASSVWTVGQSFGPKYGDPDKPTTPTSQLTLNLNQGSLLITDGGSVDAGTALIGKAGVDLAGTGTWDVPENITFQNKKNDANIKDIIPPHATLKIATGSKTPRPNVLLDNCRVDQTLKLGAGYNTVGSLTIEGGNKVDLAGQTLVPIGWTKTSGRITLVETGSGRTLESGDLIDSSGGSRVALDELETWRTRWLPSRNLTPMRHVRHWQMHNRRTKRLQSQRRPPRARVQSTYTSRLP